MIARISAAALVLLALAGTASAVELKRSATLVPSVTVDSDVVRLGDIFQDIGEKADIAVAYAPRHGSRTVFDAVWLSQAARVYKLRWRSGSRFDRVVIVRASQSIDKELIETAVLDALADRGVAGKLRVELDNRSIALFLPPESTPTVAVKDLRLNGRNGRFSATISAPADRPVAERTIHGKYYAIISIPVLGHRLGRGEVVSESDIEWIDVAEKRIQPDVITELDQLVGMAPRRFLRPRSPIRAGDVQRPVLISKGSTVTMIVRTPLMTVTARGKAVQSGSKGDVIRVMNTQSKMIVDAVVVDGSTVLVRGVGPLAAR
jgi:flagella basal body P-ring formation protein FlgA